MIAPLHRRLVDELLVELHLLSHQKGFEANSLFAVGLIQVFDAFAQGYRPPEHRELLLSALCSANGFDATHLRQQARTAREAMGHHSVEAVQQWISAAGEGAPEPLASSLASIRRPDFHYSRLMAVGLLSLLEEAQGARSLDPSALRASAHDLAVAMGLMRERVDKDISLYAGNLEKMAQAVELMEETVAADRRRRERSEASSASPATASDAAPPTAD